MHFPQTAKIGRSGSLGSVFAVCALTISCCAAEPFTRQAENSLAPVYKPAAGRSVEYQMYDKIVCFMLAAQEADGHWSAEKWGASKELSNFNGDVISTSMALYILVATVQGKNQHTEVLAAIRKGMAWLKKNVQPDGRVAELQSSEPVLTQLTASMALLQASSLSTRDDLRKMCSKAINYALLQMESPAGGFGAAAKAPESRSDVTALGAFVFRTSAMEGVKFDQPDANIVFSLRSALAILDPAAQALPNGPNPPQPSNTYKMNPGDAAANWTATASGLLTRVLLYHTGYDCQPTTAFLFGNLPRSAEKSEVFDRNVAWGKSGEGFSAMALWQLTYSAIYIVGTRDPEFKAMTQGSRKLFEEHQSRDGGFDVAGPDLRYGKVWRAAWNALTLINIAPPPPPPAPPAP